MASEAAGLRYYSVEERGAFLHDGRAPTLDVVLRKHYPSE